MRNKEKSLFWKVVDSIHVGINFNFSSRAWEKEMRESQRVVNFVFQKKQIK